MGSGYLSGFWWGGRFLPVFQRAGLVFGIQDAGLASDKVGGFCQICSPGYGDEERRGAWDYAGWVQAGLGTVLPGIQGFDLASGGVEGLCQRCGLGYGNKERRDGRGYAGQL